ncbi:hypothetical protein D3C73_1017160 [compost metagenome]
MLEGSTVSDAVPPCPPAPPMPPTFAVMDTLASTLGLRPVAEPTPPDPPPPPMLCSTRAFAESPQVVMVLPARLSVALPP